MIIDTTEAPLDLSEYVFSLDGITEASPAELSAFLKGFECGVNFVHDSQQGEQNELKA